MGDREQGFNSLISNNMLRIVLAVFVALMVVEQADLAVLLAVSENERRKKLRNRVSGVLDAFLVAGCACYALDPRWSSGER